MNRRRRSTRSGLSDTTISYPCGHGPCDCQCMASDKTLPELGLGKGDAGNGYRRPDGPLDGSTSGTIGGGGRDVGGSTPRPPAPEMPPVDPENAASGRRTPDALDAGQGPDELAPPPSDVNPK